MNNRCLFCTQRSAAVCCLRCRTTDISTMFETLLTLLGKASMTSSYYDQIRTICQQIETLEWLLTPIQFTPITHFDPKVHRVDQKAKLYLQQASLDVQNMITIEVAADGNGLYNSIICLSGNTTSTPSELRVRSLIELVKNENFYHHRFAHIIGPVNEAIKNIARNFSFSELYEIAALSNVLKCNIQSVYPTIDYRSDLNIMSNTFENAQYSIVSKAICLFWTHTESEIEARRSNAGNWSPNHFVPLLLPSDNSQSLNCLAQPKISGSGSTPTKAATKNNSLTQVRIPQFNQEDDERRSFQVPSTVIMTTNEITTPRTKRRLQLAETCASVESTIVEQKRMQARERMAAKRAAATPEEAERQRILARERSAAERSAARRAAAKSEEAERQRILARERSAARRAALTQEKAEQQRTLTRDRIAARRALLTPEEVEQQRSIDREIHAARRAALTPKEVEQQRVLAVDRSMTKRATATPIEAEEQRVLARERTAARRAARVSEEAKQQQTVAYKTTRLQKTVKQKQTVMKRKPNQDAKVDWPKPVDMDCKINCLKNFIQHMSMDSLAECVCGICNIRRYKRDLRHVPLSKIPSIELLKIHPDLHSMVPKIQEINSFNSNDSNVQSSTNNQSFTCINGMFFYEAGFYRTVDRKKRSLIHCDVCTECWSALMKEKIPKFSATNKVWMGDIPKQLQGLTIPEQRLIALYRHNSCIVKLQSPFHSNSTAQSALKGNCISFPQDVINIATTLPLELDDLCDSLKVIFVGSRMPQRSQLKHILTVRKKENL
ncbi:unnamed protein product [Rotaria magnacalcarata]|uniref:DUF6570 domain-containing protein n=1 Tax=Rotaria magnacalcarata TaxID=392030 RepID=A0A816E1Q9_9BILA|nr:unnamed protein product [Rotaria magnacalcarata]